VPDLPEKSSANSSDHSSPAQQPLCVYCESKGPFTDEHVLARAFAGPGENWMLKDLVCGDCNKLFSTYERAWTSAPGEAAARIHWGPAGRKRKGVAYQAHPSENIFLMVKDDPISYEADILRDTVPRLRAQMISAKDRIFAMASAPENAKRLTDAVNAFWNAPEITIQKRLEPGPRQFRIAVLSRSDQFRFADIQLRPKPATAWLDRFPTGLEVSCDPRMSVDADGRLRFRVRKLREVTALLNRALQEPCVSRPGGTIAADDLTLAIRSTFHVYKVTRAVAKTVVNFAVDALGPDWIGHPNFRPILDFCLGRAGDPPGAPFVGPVRPPTSIRAIDGCIPERHALCSDGSRVIGLVRLYGGTIYRVHLGQAPAGTAPFTKTVWIDYNGPGRVPVAP
jgi:hypothetical protein